MICISMLPLLYPGNPAVCPVSSSVGITQGLSTTLEVYISGYPPVRSTNVHWYRLNPTRQEITSGATFHDSRRRMVLTDVQPSDAGMYLCEATIPLIGITQLRASATIDLQVYGQLHNREGKREGERGGRRLENIMLTKPPIMLCFYAQILW